MTIANVREVMTTRVASVDRDATYHQIADLLGTRGVSAVPVVDAAGHVVGVVSESDLLHKLEFRGEQAGHRLFERRQRRHARAKAEGTTAAELMSAPAITTAPDATTVQAARLMYDENVKQLPVVDQAGTLVGLVSRHDLLAVFLRTDAAIRDEVAEQVLRNTLWLSPEQVRVDVSDGVVTLSGEVDRKSLEDIVVRLTSAVDGVVDVVNRISSRYDDTPELAKDPHWQAIKSYPL